MQLHFLLTTPTTWDESTIREFGCIARGAINTACQIPEIRAYAPSLKRLQFNITEPDAVASFMFQSHPQYFAENDSFLLLDVGGGTSDPCFCRVTKPFGQLVCTPLDPIRGLSRGCNDIDQQFQLHVRCRLQIAGISDISNRAYQMSQNNNIPMLMQRYSCVTRQDHFSIPISRYSKHFNHKEAGICNGEMILLVPQPALA